MPLINTTHGTVDESVLARTVGFEDRPSEFVVWVEWRLNGHYPLGLDCVVCGNPTNPQPDGNGVVLVRRDAHVIMKQPSVVADALVGGIGG
jgi:hypothetical protein